MGSIRDDYTDEQWEELTEEEREGILSLDEDAEEEEKEQTVRIELSVVVPFVFDVNISG